jgi:hypothetical protein
VAPRGGKSARARRLRLGRLWLVVLVGVVAFLYYRPIASWLETRAALEQRTVEVRSLRAEGARLTAGLERATSLEALGREARCLGYVKPGERLFIVKGIPASKRRCGATLAGDG